MIIRCLFVFVFLAITTLNSQIIDSKIKEIIDAKLIDAAHEKSLSEITSSIETESDAKYIYAIYGLKFKDMTGFDPAAAVDVSIDFESFELNKKELEEMKETLSNYLIKLKSVGLISKKQFNFQFQKVKNNSYVDVLQLLPDLIDQVSFDEIIEPKRLNDFRNKLFQNGIINQQNNNNLKRTIEKGEISTPYKIISYCDKATFFDVSKYSDDPKIYLEEIHKHTSEILPELIFEKFKYKIALNPEASFEDYKSYHVIISLECKGKLYEYKSFISPEDIGEKQGYLGKIDDQVYYQIFNKILDDLESPYRLHHIRSSYNYQDKFSNQYFGIIALKKDQIEIFRDFNIHWNYWRVSYEGF